VTESEQGAKTEEDKVCGDCNEFFPASADWTEWGICLKDPEFEPFFEELLGNGNYDACRDLIAKKQFTSDKPACPDFEQMEPGIEIPDDSELGREIRRLADSGKLNKDTFMEAISRDELNRTDWTSVPVDKTVAKLKSSDRTEVMAAVRSLGGLHAMGNDAAFRALLAFFREMPAPATSEDGRFKMEILHELQHRRGQKELTQAVVDELWRTPSNRTTRQWITELLTFLSSQSYADIAEPLEAMLESQQFTPRMKEKIQAVLHESRWGR
jgi:hypothetical protein